MLIPTDSVNQSSVFFLIKEEILRGSPERKRTKSQQYINKTHKQLHAKMIFLGRRVSVRSLKKIKHCKKKKKNQKAFISHIRKYAIWHNPENKSVRHRKYSQMFKFFTRLMVWKILEVKKIIRRNIPCGITKIVSISSAHVCDKWQ